MAEIVIDLRAGGDWSLDLCFAGLVQNLGYESVIDVPYKPKHREWWDVINGLRAPDWGLERRTLGFSNDVWDDRHAGILRNDKEVIKALDGNGLIDRIWLDERMESFQKYRELGLDKVDAKVVVVAGHDRFWNQSPQFVASLYGDKLQAMLLDNWYPEYANLPFKVGNIRWSTNFDHYWERPGEPPEKHIDICFVGYNSHPDRARFIDHIERRWGHLRNHIYLERRPDSFEEFLPKKMLFTIMQQSKICLNLRGAADRGKTLRAYEIPFVGSHMLSQRIDDPGMMDDFTDGWHCSYFSDESELDTMIDYLLSHDDYREEVARQGNQLATTALSVKQRWADVLRWLDGV
jgi:hypothetical protein